MHFSYILPFIAFGLGVANAAAIDDDNLLDTRAPVCPRGIDLIKLRLKSGKSFVGVGKPGDCNLLPDNVKTFLIDYKETKSLVGCFNCKVYRDNKCQGSGVLLEGALPTKKVTSSKKHLTYKAWKCDCKEKLDH
ncbi:hypothetical protein FNYG_15933 [Fusarium nygamai]|uniref:Cyanovirin-N domain-containing protein n=1 Tax=Gibberella nygamai TaxID=42673 RepID=A0A2K0TYZ5_GIBNY|nr:hypothetical protein FNYG_15933 [Fusarium nygamai]